jgi:hypothetical protein
MRALKLRKLLWSPVLALVVSAPALAADGSIKVDLSNLPGEIVLDGFPTGLQSPATLTGVAPGTHRVEISYGCVTGGVDVDVKESTLVKANIQVKNQGGNGTIRLQGVPDSATVFMDDAPIESFEKGIPAKCGGHRLMVEAPGYDSWSETVTVTTGKWTTVKLKLARGGDDEASPVVAKKPAAKPAVRPPPEPVEEEIEAEEEEIAPPVVAKKPAARPPPVEEDPDAEEDGGDEEEDVAIPAVRGNSKRDAEPDRAEDEEDEDFSAPSVAAKKPSKPAREERPAREEEDEGDMEERRPAKAPREKRERPDCEGWFCLGNSRAGAITVVTIGGLAGIGGFTYGAVNGLAYQDKVGAYNTAVAEEGADLSAEDVTALQSAYAGPKKKMIAGFVIGGLGTALTGGSIGIMLATNGSDSGSFSMSWRF